MERDIRKTALYGEVEAFYKRALEPGFGRITGASDLAASPDGRRIAFTGSRWEKLEGSPSTRVCVVDVETGQMDEVTGGPNNDGGARWSPDGSRLAFLSDRKEKGKSQLYLLDTGRLGEARAAPSVAGSAEYLAWSPDGESILVGFAGPGAEIAGFQGSGTPGSEEEAPKWMPTVEEAPGERDYRRIYIYDLASGEMRPISRPNLNVWEAAWAGPGHILAIASESPTENAWYSAPLMLIGLPGGEDRVLYRSEWQLGVPAASPSGNRLAVIEAVCSDRGVVAGDLLLVDLADGKTQHVNTGGVDITGMVWRDEDHLFFSGIRGMESVVGEYDAADGTTRELYATRESLSYWYPDVTPLGDGAFAGLPNSFRRFPEITVFRGGEERAVTSLAHDGVTYLQSLGGRVEEVSWRAPDGLEIQGLLYTPDGPEPHPLIVHVHGGPVGSIHDRWLGATSVAYLLDKGYAFLFPNPRGSSGRGQEFARMVYGDVGGSETEDTLSGIDRLVQIRVADPARIGVMGGSHGGYMSSWLITQTHLFAAAVPMHPVTDFYSQHRTSNIGSYDQLFLQADPYGTNNGYWSRSPIMFAGNVRTPTLNIAGEVDRCTPPGQAREFHESLLENGVESVLVTYPGEGHGVRRFPAAIDLTTRVVEWFERHMPAQRAAETAEEAPAVAARA